ncbi:MAG: asparagine synthase B [Candidatus Bipolaricaulia bacterium]
MCGIAGYFALERGASPAQISVETMLERLRHRGPDDSGVWQSKRAALGHTRLSIIDVPGGRQPIANEDGSIQIVYNGEIYNFPTLRAALAHRHQLRTRTDTEVVVHTYEEHGPECVKLFDGMFAFALIDGDELLLARDPLGVKPLYYAFADGRLYFASEIKALVPVTEDIHEFPPGHWFHSKLGWRKYFHLRQPPVGEREAHAQRDWLALVREALSAAVTKRLISDVPVGVFLSGGLDSSLVAALMREHIPELHSFSVGTPAGQDPIYARKVAQHLGTVHHEYIYTEAEMLQILPKVIYHLESFDFALVRSAIANYFVARLAKDFVKVVLVGEGADELFGGYHYLKEISDEEQLHQELLTITSKLHNSNLQRVDRMTMAHGIEGREPYLDLDLVRVAFALPPQLKRFRGIEKYILRKAFEGFVPDEILWREKEKFSRGAGLASVFAEIAEREISDREFERECHLFDTLTLRSKEELYYYRIWRRFFPDSVAHCLSWTTRPEAR